MTQEGVVQASIMYGLKPFDAVDQQITQLQGEYHGLKINGPEDKDGYKIVKEAWRHLREVRLGAEKLHKELKADALAYSKACDARLRQIKDGLTPMEEDFYAQWKAEDTRKEREAEEARLKAEAERAAKMEARKQQLFALGMTWNGQTFASRYAGIDEVSAAMVEGADDAVWDAKVEAITAKTQAAREAERKAKEEQERLAAELKAREEALRKQQEEQERKAHELERQQAELRAKTNEARMNELMAIGAIHGKDYDVYNEVLHEVLDWPAFVEQVKASVTARQERERIEAEAAAKAEAERKAKEEAERIAREKAIAEEAARKERERIEAERIAKERAEKEAAEAAARAEEKRLKKLGDKGVMGKAVEVMNAADGELVTLFKTLKSEEAIAIARKCVSTLRDAMSEVEAFANQ